jgi:hypothetical protein
MDGGKGNLKLESTSLDSVESLKQNLCNLECTSSQNVVYDSNKIDLKSSEKVQKKCRCWKQI